MKTTIKILGAVLITALVCSAPSIAQNITEVTQGAPGKKGAWNVTSSAAAPTITAQKGQTYAPGVPIECAAAGGVSCPLTAFVAAGSCLRITCLADCSYRVGTGAQVALITDNRLYAKVIERECLLSTQESMAFFCAVATTCSASVIPNVP